MLVSNVIAQRIIETAEQTFLQRGFARVSMDELADSLGMSKKTLYQHFSGKDDLLAAVLRHRTETVGRSILGILESAAPFPEKFRDLLNVIQRRMNEIQPVFLEDLQRYAPEHFRIIEEFRARMLPVFFGKILDEGAAAGLIRGDLDRALFIRIAVNAIQSLVRPGILTELKMHPWEGIDGILQIFFEGILTPQGRQTCGRYFLKS
ncbi:MAG TPA: TetR/AcrR family transcriptional regulator [Chthoniobacterales bacterium]